MKMTRQEIYNRAVFLKRTETYNPIGIIRRISGLGLIYYGIGTIVLPTGSIWAIGIGCALLSIDPKEVIDKVKFYTQKAYNALYGLRSWELIKYNWRLKNL